MTSDRKEAAPNGPLKPEPDAESREWLEISHTSLAAAYGEAEPEYSDSMIKEPNPEYQSDLPNSRG